jgi:hypothetical protein
VCGEVVHCAADSDERRQRKQLWDQYRLDALARSLEPDASQGGKIAKRGGCYLVEQLTPPSGWIQRHLLKQPGDLVDARATLAEIYSSISHV